MAILPMTLPPKTIQSLLALKERLHRLPSAQDLDAIAEEQRIQKATAGPTMRHARHRGESWQRYRRSEIARNA